MDQKKTTSIAVMINMGLLVLLFFAAVHQNDDLPRGIEISQPAREQQNKPLFGEEIDLALKPLPPAATPKPAESIAAPQQPLIPPASPEAGSPMSSIAFLRSYRIQLLENARRSARSRRRASSCRHAADHQRFGSDRQEGDTLEKIAKAHHASIDEIIKINRLPSSFLRVGQTLKIPSSTALVKPKPAAPKAPEGQAEYYTVKVGDNPWTIAMKNRLESRGIAQAQCAQ